jgi:high affinity sulfate transporter 1
MSMRPAAEGEATLATVKDDATGSAKGGKKPLPGLQGILPIDKPRVSTDILAGITLAALGIPEVMGYANIAGMPVVTGLYMILIPIAVFALLGSSRHLVVGADSASAAILAAGLAGMAATGSSQYIALASLTALITGVILIVARLIKLGFLADFLSRTVLIGFLTGVGIQVAMGQLPGVLGVQSGTGGTLSKFWGTIRNIPDTSLTTLAVSFSVLVVILGAKAINPKIPGALIAVVGSIVVSKALDLSAHGVSTLGHVPGGLPSFGFPSGMSWSNVSALFPTAFSIFIVILAQSAATSRAYAAKYTEQFSENVDLVGLGMANFSAGFSGTFAVNGSPTKTQMVDSAGGRSQLSTLTTSVIVLVVLLFLTKPLQYMPNAVLAAVVLLIGIELVDIPGMRKILKVRPEEFVVAAITAAVVVIVGVEQGILLAIVLSLIDHLRHGYAPRDTLLVPKSGGHWKWTPLDTPTQAAPGLFIYRFSASLYYANANRFTEEILGIVSAADPPVRWLCIDAAGIDDVDYSAGQTVREIHGELKERNIRLVVAEVPQEVREELARYDLVELLGEDAFFDTVSEVIEAYQNQSTER